MAFILHKEDRFGSIHTSAKIYYSAYSMPKVQLPMENGKKKTFNSVIFGSLQGQRNTYDKYAG